MDLSEVDLKANPGAFSTLDLEVIAPYLEKLEPNEIYLEIGVDKGKSLSIAKMVCKEGVKIFGVDINKPPELTEFLKNNPDIQFIQGESVLVAKQFKGGKIKLLFIDGDHSYKGCSDDISWWIPNLDKDAVVFFHDCDESSPGVMQAVSEYVELNKGSVKEFKLYKTQDKNTSMAKIQL